MQITKYKSEYLSLAEAARCCKYSQEYLSLRARHGKLKSIKLGRNWVTTREWLDEYVKNSDSFNGQKTVNCVFTKKVSAARDETGLEVLRHGLPPGNLPVGEPAMTYAFSKSGETNIFTNVFFAASLAMFVFSMSMITVLSGANTDGRHYAANLIEDYLSWIGGGAPFSTSPVAGYSYGKNASELLSSFENIANVVKKYFADIQKDLSLALGIIADRINSFAGTESPRKAGEFTGGRSPDTQELEEGIITDVQQRFKEFRQEAGITINKEGLVVVPSGTGDEAKKKIMRSFSDEVIVEPQDETSGIIKPVFREVAEQAYLYMMVPLKN